MDASQAHAGVANAFSRLSGAVRARTVISVLKAMCAERILKWAGIAETTWSHTEADVLSKYARCNVYGKRRHIRIDCDTTLPCTLDVNWIIE